ncbi:SAM dependent carboxyl methyltransferase [Dillenia turbinata]|uniref:SAM dependent carboxyl methyltransferase n=1 Tax=Dillenia turbinata TaxID=194707 RepID=A0AAN8YV58_9MAGN
MAEQESNALVEAHPMNGGDGPNSYAQNSTVQKRDMEAAKEMISEAISKHLDIDPNSFSNPSQPFRIADLGCSIGPNTFFAVQNIIEAAESKFKSIKQKSPQFQVFFNDHVENDFNTLFRSLPSTRKYFATGVPGSFYAPLFPNSSLHIIHLSFALHWLSTVPKDHGNSLCWNKESIYCTGKSKEVADAYFGQFKRDMDLFLNARAEEIVSGGLMCLIMYALPNRVKFSDTLAGYSFELLGDCLKDMAKRGVISEEKVESFNIPQYIPTMNEVKEVIKQNQRFRIVSIGTLENPSSVLTDQMFVGHLRAIVEGVIKNHFGDEMDTDELFSLCLGKLRESCHLFDDEKYLKNINLCIFLKTQE